MLYNTPPMQHKDVPPIVCRHCPKLVPIARQRRRGLFCSRSCSQAHATERYRALNTRLPVSTGTVGAIAELAVAVDLLQRGYDVFRAVSPSCACDLAVVRAGQLTCVEVTTGYQTAPGRIMHCKKPSPH